MGSSLVLAESFCWCSSVALGLFCDSPLTPTVLSEDASFTVSFSFLNPFCSKAASPSVTPKITPVRLAILNDWGPIHHAYALA